MSSTIPNRSASGVFLRSAGGVRSRNFNLGMWDPRVYHTSLVHDAKIWVIAGETYGPQKNDVWYSENGAVWIRATSNAGWAARSRLASVVFDDQMLILGGKVESYLGTFRFNDVWSSTDGVTWDQVAPFSDWPGQYHHTALSALNQIFVIGGYAVFIPHIANVWASSNGTDWEEKSTFLMAGHTGHTSVFFDDKIWNIGGERYEIDYNWVKKNEVWFSSDGVTWTRATHNAGWSPRIQHTSVVFDGKMWVIGGSNSGDTYSDVWYSTDGESWTQATSDAGWGPRFGHTSVVFDGKIWVIGGYVDDVGIVNDVWSSPDGVTWTQVR